MLSQQSSESSDYLSCESFVFEGSWREKRCLKYRCLGGSEVPCAQLHGHSPAPGLVLQCLQAILSPN